MSDTTEELFGKHTEGNQPKQNWIGNLSNLRNLLEDEKNEEKIFSGACENYNHGELKDSVMRSFAQNPKLFGCTWASLARAMQEIIVLRLVLGGVLGQCYISPYKGKVRVLAGYLGLKELAFRSDRIADFAAEVVREGDKFEFEYGTERFLRHKPAFIPEARVEAVYAIGRTTTGGVQFIVWSYDQIEEHRKKYGSKSPAWNTAWAAMAKKTVFIPLVKLLPVSPELQRLTQLEERIERKVPIEAEIKEGDTVGKSDLDQLAEQAESVELPEVAK